MCSNKDPVKPNKCKKKKKIWVASRWVEAKVRIIGFQRALQKSLEVLGRVSFFPSFYPCISCFLKQLGKQRKCSTKFISIYPADQIWMEVGCTELLNPMSPLVCIAWSSSGRLWWQRSRCKEGKKLSHKRVKELHLLTELVWRRNDEHEEINIRYLARSPNY